MIRSLKIENFKSIDRLEISLGRVNLFIGENGCGKSNIIEAVSFGAAAAADKLDHEFLVSRGIRVTDPKLMRAAFTAETLGEPIKVSFISAELNFEATLEHPGTPYASWTNSIPIARVAYLLSGPDFRGISLKKVWGVMRALASLDPRDQSSPPGLSLKEEDRKIAEALSSAHRPLAIDFLAYTPELRALQSLDLESSIEPIGIHGEGLFKLLQQLESEGHLPEIKQQLEMIEWFADLEVFSGPNPATRALRIHDQYLDSAVAHFDQRSANEGFLFLLLYACLLVSKYTPAFFAVDNIETGLNPKLCAALLKMFARLTKAHDKQVLLTTHNPGALDGIDLNDDEQRLFVVYRNVDGCTRVRRIERADLPASEQPVRLSEAFLRGYIGGLPTNF